MAGEKSSLKKLVLHPSFRETIHEMNRQQIRLPPHPVADDWDFNQYTFPSENSKLLLDIEEFGKVKLDPRSGEELIKEETPICGYDESINKFACLAGVAYLICHTLILLGKRDYIPSCYLTLYFYTRSKAITENSKSIKYSEDPAVDSKKDYASDREDFLISNAPSRSILFIDGPLIGAQLSSQTTGLNQRLLKDDVLPIFFVKNSSGCLVINNTPHLNGNFNSDMHWAYDTLGKGERTNFFHYRDKDNVRNAKCFCYMKAFDASPQRIEFHVDTLNKYGKEEMSNLMSVVYYLLLVQGELRNPQIRPIAVAEKYARGAINLIDLDKMMKETGMVSTINQGRFGWG